MRCSLLMRRDQKPERACHELCHLIHPNHSKAFWQLLARHGPAYATHRQWLKERGGMLMP